MVRPLIRRATRRALRPDVPSSLLAHACRHPKEERGLRVQGARSRRSRRQASIGSDRLTSRRSLPTPLAGRPASAGQAVDARAQDQGGLDPERPVHQVARARPRRRPFGWLSVVFVTRPSQALLALSTEARRLTLDRYLLRCDARQSSSSSRTSSSARRPEGPADHLALACQRTPARAAPALLPISGSGGAFCCRLRHSGRLLLTFIPSHALSSP